MNSHRVKPAQSRGLTAPTQEERAALLQLDRTETNHRASFEALSCLNRLEAPVRPAAPPLTFPFVAATWNLERCYAPEASAALIADTSAALLLASELDCGMARTGQRHTTAALAAQLDMGYAFGVEFVELGLGGPNELEFCTDDFNTHGFHGNAILARPPLLHGTLIRLEDHGHWFTPESPEARIGTRCAIAAVIETTSGPVCAISVHLENRAPPAYRARQIGELLETIEGLHEDMPVLLGGDLNTGSIGGAGLDAESLFDLARERGFERHGGPLDQMTTRPSRVSRTPKGAAKLDWFLTRGLEIGESRIVPALAPDGEVLSDHDMVTIDVLGIRSRR